jgi:SSS family solute:Na+ symporter
MQDPARPLEFIALAMYLAALMWIGLRSARRIRTSEDFAVAGRNVPWFFVLATTAATMVGGGASVGTVAKVYDIGIAAAVITFAWHLQLIFTGVWIAPKLRGLNLLTVGDFFGRKFGPAARALAVLNSLIFLTGGLAAQMVAMGKITEAFLGIEYAWALVIGATITIFYSTVGGMRAVVNTDILQFVVLVCGFAAAAAILLARHGGFEGLQAQLGSQELDLTQQWSGLKIAGLFVVYLLGETFAPVYTMRCFIAKDPRHARWGIAGAGLFLLLFLPIVTMVLGLCAKASYPEIDSQQAFPTLIRATFPAFWAGVLIAALIAAVMSSGDSVLASGATVVMQDIYRQYLKPDASDRAALRVAQRSTLIGGIAATCWAWYSPDIIGALEFIYDFWAPAMVLPFLVGVLWYHPQRNYAVLFSMVAGLVVTIIWQLICREPTHAESVGTWLGLSSATDIPAALVGVAVAIAVFFLALPLTQRWRLGAAVRPE